MTHSTYLNSQIHSLLRLDIFPPLMFCLDLHVGRKVLECLSLIFLRFTYTVSALSHLQDFSL